MTEQNKQQISIGGLTFDVADVEYLTIKRDGYKIVIERDEDSKQNAVTGFAKQQEPRRMPNMLAGRTLHLNLFNETKRTP